MNIPNFDPAFVRTVGGVLSRAELGDAAAQRFIGIRFYWGAGLPQDYTEAAKWLGSAAHLDDADAQALLGSAYRSGRGVPSDLVEAAKWLGKAAEQGIEDAWQALSRLYATGKGVPTEYVQAYKWISLWYSTGRRFIPQLDVLSPTGIAKLMTPEQVAHADALVRDWKPVRIMDRYKAESLTAMCQDEDLSMLGVSINTSEAKEITLVLKRMSSPPRGSLDHEQEFSFDLVLGNLQAQVEKAGFELFSPGGSLLRRLLQILDMAPDSRKQSEELLSTPEFRADLRRLARILPAIYESGSSPTQEL